jgi:hypothetical protein
MGEVDGARFETEPARSHQSHPQHFSHPKKRSYSPRFLLEYSDDELIDLERKAQKSGPPNHELRWRVVCYKINLLTNAEFVK